jgi:hypothetical protein
MDRGSIKVAFDYDNMALLMQGVVSNGCSRSSHPVTWSKFYPPAKSKSGNVRGPQRPGR